MGRTSRPHLSVFCCFELVTSAFQHAVQAAALRPVAFNHLGQEKRGRKWPETEDAGGTLSRSALRSARNPGVLEMIPTLLLNFLGKYKGYLQK